LIEAMKLYTGQRARNGTCHVHVVEEGRRRALPWRLDLFNHSPTGFNWGYGGSGPAQLALAILADLLGDDVLAVRLHQPFKWQVVARLRSDDWALDESTLRSKINEIIAREKSIGAL
jgi:hypothetical protein